MLLETLSHNRSYSIGGFSFVITADLPFTSKTFHPKFEVFREEHPGSDFISLDHHFSLPEISNLEPDKLVYSRLPWAIYRSKNGWLYLGVSVFRNKKQYHQVVEFDQDHTQANIFHQTDKRFLRGNLDSITLFPTDQILLARVLADRQGCIFHSAGMVIDGQGLLFAGHSGAGKSTIVTQLMPHGEILCDDRMIIRRWPEGFRIHGTWSHGTVPIVSPGSAPLRAIFLLEQADENRLVPVEDRKELARLFPFLVIKPLVTADWWEKTFDLLEKLIREVPVYRLRFDLSGRVIDTLRPLISDLGHGG